MTASRLNFTITDSNDRVIAKFALLSEASTAADALRNAYNEKLWVQERGVEGYVYTTAPSATVLFDERYAPLK